MTMRNREHIDISSPTEKVEVPTGGLKISRPTWNPVPGAKQARAEMEARATAVREAEVAKAHEDVGLEPLKKAIFQLQAEMRFVQQKLLELEAKANG